MQDTRNDRSNWNKIWIHIEDLEYSNKNRRSFTQVLTFWNWEYNWWHQAFLLDRLKWVSRTPVSSFWVLLLWWNEVSLRIRNSRILRGSWIGVRNCSIKKLMAHIFVQTFFQPSKKPCFYRLRKEIIILQFQLFYKLFQYHKIYTSLVNINLNLSFSTFTQTVLIILHFLFPSETFIPLNDNE